MEYLCWCSQCRQWFRSGEALRQSAPPACPSCGGPAARMGEGERLLVVSRPAVPVNG